MNDRVKTTEPAGQFGTAEQARQAEPATAETRQAFAADAVKKDTRAADAPVAIDGQMLEAGYGHGV